MKNLLESPICVYTIGHSTKSIEDFVHVLEQYTIQKVVDVRTVPRSRHNPQFNRDILLKSLASYHIEYEHIPGLGGFRHPKPDSVNTGWRNASFRGFADYMQTAEFVKYLDYLIQLAKQNLMVIMCAESVPWRCHRSLISDALTLRNIEVIHIFSESYNQNHQLTPFARVEGLTLTYPATGVSSLEAKR